MANATVQKLKMFGLRFGDKLGVAFATLLCLVMIALSLSKKSIDLTPDELKATAESAGKNLDQRQDENQILTELEGQGVVLPNLVATVDKQAQSTLLAAAFQIPNPWQVPEPGAGLIRDQPKILSPTDLDARFGRGGALLFALNDKGDRIEDTGEDAMKKAESKSRRRPSGGGRGMSMGGGGMGGGMSGGYGGMMGGAAGKPSQSQKEEEEKKRAAAERKLKESLGGRADAKPKEKEKSKGKDEAAEETVETGPAKVYKEETRGERWVAIIGVLDHKQMRKNYADALKLDVNSANPNYKRMDIERKQQNPDGTWPEKWSMLDYNSNLRVLDNIPEQDEELTPDEVRLEALVDPLPFLKAGYWRGVHVGGLVPKEKKEVPKAPEGGMMGGGMAGMMGGRGMMSGGGGMPGMMSGGGGVPGMMSGGGMPGSGGMGGRGMMMGGGEPGMMSGGMGMMGGGGGGPADTAFETTEAEEIMVRALDFTVQPDSVYKYRVRVVLYNPNYQRENIAPGVDNSSEELSGPWSEETAATTVPRDISNYVVRSAPTASNPYAPADLVEFMVSRWNPADGMTVVKNFTASPGDIIGRAESAEVPGFDGAKSEFKLIDFNSHSLVVDTMAGSMTMPPIPGNITPPELSAVAVEMRADGRLVLRDQARDAIDNEGKDLLQTYRDALKESGKKREAPGMMGGYGGMMSGGAR